MSTGMGSGMDFGTTGSADNEHLSDDNHIHRDITACLELQNTVGEHHGWARAGHHGGCAQQALLGLLHGAHKAALHRAPALEGLSPLAHAGPVPDGHVGARLCPERRSLPEDAAQEDLQPVIMLASCVTILLRSLCIGLHATLKQAFMCRVVLPTAQN